MTAHDIYILQERIDVLKAEVRAQLHLAKPARDQRLIDSNHDRIHRLQAWIKGVPETQFKPELTEAQRLQKVRAGEDVVLRQLRREEFEKILLVLDGKAEGASTMIINTVREVDYVFDLLHRELYKKQPPRQNLNLLWSKGAIAYFQNRVKKEIRTTPIKKAAVESMTVAEAEAETETPKPNA